MSEIKVNKITPKQNCTQVTLGDSGDTFVIPSGVTITNNGTQTGFGRTGTVNWDTTAKTASFTSVSGNGYFVNTTSGVFTATLPASPSAGDIVAFADYANTWDTNNLTIGRNSSNIEGSASDFVCNIEGASITFVYVDATKGWITVNAGNSSSAFVNPFITATGGTITTCGDFKIHTFTGPGTFCVSDAGTGPTNIVSYLVIAGGGGGGFCVGGGGGAGGFREGKSISDCYTASPLNAPVGLPVNVTAYPIIVGSGGTSGTTGIPGGNGANSIFSTITSAGGGGGGTYNAPDKTGSNGGSGGGGGGWNNPGPKTGGSGNTPPVSPPQGNPGGDGPPVCAQRAGGGGGGAGGSGTNSPPCAGPPTATPAAPGGAGLASSITGSPVTRGAGGQGSNDNTPTPATGGTANSGNGGHGAGAPNPVFCGCGGTGGSGIVIIRYKYQ